MITTVGHTEFMQLVGLLALAQGYNEKLNDIRETVLDMLDLDDDEDGTEVTGFVDDAVYNGDRTEKLLKRLGILVVDDPLEAEDENLGEAEER